MGKSTWHFYDKATRLFTGSGFTGTREDLQRQLDHKGPDIGAFDGEVDWLSQKLHPERDELLDHKPDPPWDGTDLTLRTTEPGWNGGIEPRWMRR